MAKNTNFNPMRDLVLMTQATTINNEIKKQEDPAKEPATKMPTEEPVEEEPVIKELVEKTETKVPEVRAEETSTKVLEEPAVEEFTPKIKESESALNHVQEQNIALRSESITQVAEHEVISEPKSEVIPASGENNEEKLAPRIEDGYNSLTTKSEFLMIPSSLAGRNDLIQCGFVISRKNRFYLKKTAVQNEVNLNTVISTILNDQYDIGSTLTEDEVMKIEDDYYHSQRTNVKMTFVIPKFLRDFLKISAAESGLKISTMLNYFITIEREAAEKK